MNIIEFIEAPGTLNDRTLSPAQKMVLKSIYGLALTAVGGNQKGAKNGSIGVGRKTLSSSLSPFLYLRDAV